MSAKKPEKGKKIQTPEDYALALPTQPKPPKLVPFQKPSSSIPLTPNPFQPLRNFSPLNYAQTVSPQQSSTTSISTQSQVYFTKPICENIFLTRYTQDQNLDFREINNLASKIFPKDTHFNSDDGLKTQKYYELILVDSKSIELKHNMDSKDTSTISYSNCKILQVLKSTEWLSPHCTKMFSISYVPPGYSYHDYKMAWYRAFFIRPFTHSWFFYFDKNISKEFPIWFHEWWAYFGSQADIIPPPIQHSFELFIKNTKIQPFERTLQFHATFGVPWIMCWCYQIKQILPPPLPKSLIREFKIKWWVKYNPHFCSPQLVQDYIQFGKILVKEIKAIPASTPPLSQKIPQVSPSSSGTIPASPSTPKKKMSRDELASFIQQYFAEEQTEQEEESKLTPEEPFDPFGGPCSQDPYDF